MTQKQKKETYELALKQINSVLIGETHMIVKMATINCLLRDNFSYYFWTGFYLVHEGELVVGPYQGTLGTLDIPFGKGVCGTAAQERKTQIVKDVHKFPGHISCDSRSKSEIVVPIFNREKELIAVFDVDSTEIGSFDQTDKTYLETLLHEQFGNEFVN